MTNTTYSNHATINENDITFRTLYEYVQQAEREEFGYHFPFGRETDIAASTFMHIYDGRLQMNVNIGDRPVANFLFWPDEEKVRLVRVSDSGIADYSSEPYLVSFDDTIADSNNGWSLYFGGIGRAVKEVFRDTLPTYLKSLMPEEHVADNVVESASEVDIMMHYGIISHLLDDINGILANYPRYIGKMVMISAEVENEIESKCNLMLDTIATMKKPGFLDRALNKDEILVALSGVEEQAKRDLAEVARAKEFLANYYSH